MNANCEDAIFDWWRSALLLEMPRYLCPGSWTINEVCLFFINSSRPSAGEADGNAGAQSSAEPIGNYQFPPTKAASGQGPRLASNTRMSTILYAG